MTNHSTPQVDKKHDDHGSMSSYVIGFVFSIIFTVVPYLLVTRNIMSGTTLLLIVLGLAIVQMSVQIIFFLHLGRGPKPLYNIVFFGATAGLIVLVIGASILIMNNLYSNMSAKDMITHLSQEENIATINGIATGACQGNNANHTVTIQEGVVSPQFIEARRCDTLTIATEDGKDRQITFEIDSAAVSYGGEHKINTRSDRAKIITLNEIGTFRFIDTADKATSGSFTVTP
jgi:cytochrome o ubiquinol oxidase subunit IV